MEYKEALEIYDCLNYKGYEQDLDYVELLDDMINCAITYARIRTDWIVNDIVERAEIDETRTRYHNAFISSCNILSRYMAKKCLDVTWRSRLGEDRKIIGDFACYLHCILGIKAR